MIVLSSKVLLVGSGGREDAIARQLNLSGSRIYAVMGHRNPSINRLSTEQLICAETDFVRILDFAISKKVDLAFIGPDPVLGTPLVDNLIANGVQTASPSKKAARIETDKIFMRDLASRYRIGGEVFSKSFESVEECASWIRSYDTEFVVKPRGLTGGKGVQVMGDHFIEREQGIAYAKSLIEKDGSVLIEEKLVGEEFSLQAFCDGKHISPMPLAQDYKRALEGDQGPNTGGMGSISDANHLLPFVDSNSMNDALKILNNCVVALDSEDSTFKGVLYGQFMKTRHGTKLVEINARFADPEGINMLSIFEGDLEEVMFSIASGNLSNSSFKKVATVLKYVVPRGYGSDPQESTIHIDLDSIDGADLYYASVTGSLEDIKTTKSRSLAIVASAPSIPEASDIVDSNLAHIHGDYYVRRDIGSRNLLNKKMLRI